MSNPLEQYRQQQLRNGEKVVEIAKAPPRRRTSVKEMAENLDRHCPDTPGPSPAKPRKPLADATDVFAILGVKKSEEATAIERRKAAVVGKAANKLLAGLRTRGLGAQKRSTSPTSPTSPAKVAARAFGKLSVSVPKKTSDPMPSPSAAAVLTEWLRPARDGGPPVDAIEPVVVFEKPSSEFQPGGTACVCVSVAPGHDKVAAGYFDGGLRVYDLKDRALLHDRFTSGYAPPDVRPQGEFGVDPAWGRQPPAVINVQWRPTASPSIPSTVLAVTDTAGAVMLWDVNRHQCKEVAKVVDEGNEMVALGFTHDGQRLVVGGKKRYLRVHDLELREVATIAGTAATINDDRIMSHTNRITHLCCHPINSDLVITSSWDTTVQTWDLRCPSAPVRVFEGNFSSSGSSIDVSANGDWLVACNGSSLEFYDVGSGRQLYSTTHAGNSLVWPGGAAAGFFGRALELPMHFVQFSKDPASSTVLTAGGQNDAPCAFALRTPALRDPAQAAGPGLAYGGLEVRGHLAMVSEQKRLFRAFDSVLASSGRHSVAAYGSADGTLRIAHVPL